MGHYKSNVRDIEFNLFEDLGVGEVLASGAYGDLDEDTAKEMLREAARQAEGPIAESFAEADRNPPVFNPETHEVKINEAFKKSQAIFADGGWAYLGLNDELGGTDVPRSLYWGIGELFLGANPPVFMFAAGPGFAQILFDEAPTSRRSGRRSPLSATGTPPWCSPSRTPARTWARAAPRPSSRRTAPGTSRA